MNTNLMASSNGLSEFYINSQELFENPSDPSTGINYPFGLWLFGASLAKITGLPPITVSFFYCTLSLLILIGSFYVYSSLWLESREEKLCALLFLISMPQFSIILMNYSPSIFILPLLFITLFIIFKEPAIWKLLPIAWLLIFIIVISHTGTFLFLITFSLVFFLLYCLIWGKFSKPLYTAILSIIVIYVFSLSLFPNIANQYKIKSMMFLLPGNFFASKFNFPFPGDLIQLFYQNLLVEQQFIYVIILAALLFAIGNVLVYIHRKTSTILSKNEKFPAFILPLQNLSHSLGASPIWLGPFHVLFSVFGIFHLDNKGKCFLITALLTTVLPDIFQELQGISTLTGALREISYLVIIIPITATLGFWHILAYLNDPLSKPKKLISSALWVIVCIVIIITPTLATTYYVPTISGEDYVIDGLKWLGENGDKNEFVEGWLLRPVEIYTNMTSGDRNLLQGTMTKTFLNLLQNIYFMPRDQIRNSQDLQKNFGVRYILSSERILRYFRGTTENLTIDSNPTVSKIYGSNDFGIYQIGTSSENAGQTLYLGDTISLIQKGGFYEIESDYYKVILGVNAPVLKRFGSSQNNLLGSGFIKEDFKISGTEINLEGGVFTLEDMMFTHEIKDNQITYITVLKNPQSQVPMGTLLIRYTFYPEVIKREYVLSNDWFVAKYIPQIDVQYSLLIYSPGSQFMVKNEKTRFERHLTVSEDSVNKNINIEDFYLNDGKNGMYITFSALSPQPSSLRYGGSIYNMSSVGIIQSTPVKSGASFLSTQFLSLGNEYDAKKNIQKRVGIELINYPDGITPIMISGYRIPQSDMSVNEKITTGYAVLKNSSIPYAEAINPSIRIEQTSDLQNATSPRVLSINLQEISNNNITIVSSQKTGITYFDDYNTQETNIMLLSDYTKKQGVSYTGFMPDSFNYNFNTLTILSNNKIPFLFSNQVSTLINGEYAKGYRTPQIAYINSKPTNVVLFPVSNPMSTMLLSQPWKEDTFSSWKAIIDEAADNDEMVLFLIRSQDIGNPSYTEEFVKLFSYARDKGLTFTSPDLIAEHYKQLKDIRYSGLIDNDNATIQVMNTNNVTVSNVTFKVILPELAFGDYRVNDGKIVKTKHENGQAVLYISTVIPANSTKKIIIEPDIQRKFFQIEVPQQPIIEGSNTITVKDGMGNPLRNVEVIVDSSYHQTDEKGAVHMDLMRGYHNISVQSPGYEKYSIDFNVRGRIFIIEQIIGRIF